MARIVAKVFALNNQLVARRTVSTGGARNLNIMRMLCVDSVDASDSATIIL